MDEKSLYAHILNLTASWQVKALSLDEKVVVTVTVGIAENVLLSCPTCGKTCPVHDHRHRKWRHLDTCQFTTVLKPMSPESCARPWLSDLTCSMGRTGKPIHTAVRVVRHLMAEDQHHRCRQETAETELECGR
ncbi:transposase, ISL3 family [Klebsiella pneumoniae]|uniref:Transposase, ISL3 family n=1 Tax=Klebsiella pneumoniae TaxID=573 RepID=A0A2X1SCV4_KLEPN|nr:transposase, ISL3 family [Klebsiella pneumoniae]